VKQEFDAAVASASYTGITYSRDGRTLYDSQANGHVIVACVGDGGTLTLTRLIDMLPPSPISYPGREDRDPYPGVLALTDDGGMQLVVLSRNNTLDFRPWDSAQACCTCSAKLGSSNLILRWISSTTCGLSGATS
jgi:hypothetical protein